MKAKKAKKAKFVYPKSYSSDAYRIVIASPVDFNDFNLWPLPSGEWRAVMVDPDGYLIARSPEAIAPFLATDKGVVRGKSSAAWKDYTDGLFEIFADPKVRLDKIVFVSMVNGQDASAPPYVKSIPTKTTSAQAAKAASAPSVEPKKDAPSVTPDKVAKSIPPAPKKVALPSNFVLPTEDDFDAGEDNDDSTMGPLILVGGLALAAAVVWYNRRGA